MKSKILSKARLISAVLVLLTIGLVTGFAESISADGCPKGTGGYESTGIRNKRVCTQSIRVSGYWWHIKGEVKWVGTIFAGMGGEFEKATREIFVTGQEYTCRGIDNVCWVCNCYYMDIPNEIEF